MCGCDAMREKHQDEGAAATEKRKTVVNRRLPQNKTAQILHACICMNECMYVYIGPLQTREKFACIFACVPCYHCLSGLLEQVALGAGHRELLVEGAAARLVMSK
jgi:hypothetical protein